MTKQEQIEKMAKVIDKTIRNECLLKTGGCPACNFLGIDTDEYECQSLLVSTMLYNAGYRKVSDNYIGTDNVLRSIDYRPVDEVRKETAKEILVLLGKGFDETKKTEFKNLPWYKSFCKELKHRYDIEVEE